ncbi:uncharacterized protein, partial [Macrobrachium rosenbergii]|uniref:uncharacterized protein n=1 Tax=Macrobrachium rosenbergii TaxID=79674 RepID=UPI0034D54FEB
VPPVCAPGQQRVFGAARHEEVLVHCTVEAYPVPTSFRWAVNTSTGQVDIALSHSVSSGTQSTVRYTPQTHLDFGELLCWAENEVDLQETPCVFQVIPAAKPESVSDCLAERNSTMPASTVLVTCAVTSDRGLNQTFTLEVRQKATEEVLEKFSLATKPHFLVTGLKIGVPYLLTITPANSRGSGPPFTLSYTPPSASADKVIFPYSEAAILSFTPLLIVILGVLTGVSGCVGVAVVLGRKRKHPWRGKVEDQMRISYCRSSKGVGDAEDLPTIMRLTNGYDEGDEDEARRHAARATAARSSLYSNPAECLNNEEILLTKALHCELRASSMPHRDTLQRTPPSSRGKDTTEQCPPLGLVLANARANSTPYSSPAAGFLNPGGLLEDGLLEGGLRPRDNDSARSNYPTKDNHISAVGYLL